MQPSNEKLLYSCEVIIMLLGPQVADVICPENEKGNILRPKADIKSGVSLCTFCYWATNSHKFILNIVLGCLISAQ